MSLITLFFLVICQNLSFTMVSRARNSGSYLYNGAASVASNGIWLVVFKKLTLSLDDISTYIVYIVAAVIGSVLMQWVSIKFIENKKYGAKRSI